MPARIDQMTGKTQYYDGTDWLDVNFNGKNDAEVSVSPKGILKLSYNPESRIKKPGYYSHFSIHKIENGFPSQLEFDDDATLADVSGLELDEGTYMSLTGQRLSDGSVLVKGEIFPVAADMETASDLELRHDDSKVGVIGNLNAENLYYDRDLDKQKSILSTTGRGNYILGIVRANSEPSAHALNDISQRREEFEKLDEKMILLVKNGEDVDKFNWNAFPNLPSGIARGADTGSVSLDEIVASLSLPDDELPVFVIADSFNRILFVSQGYTIGLGDRILDTLHRISEQEKGQTAGN